jgi:hypothetical protein
MRPGSAQPWKRNYGRPLRVTLRLTGGRIFFWSRPPTPTESSEQCACVARLLFRVTAPSESSCTDRRPLDAPDDVRQDALAHVRPDPRAPVTWNAATRGSSRRWLRFCASMRGQGHQEDRGSRQTEPRLSWRSSLMTRSQPFRRSPTRRRTSQAQRACDLRARSRNKRYSTVSLLTGIDLLTGQVHALVRDRHHNCEACRCRLSSSPSDQS